MRADKLDKPNYSVSEGAYYRRDTVIPYARLLYGIVCPNDPELEHKFVSKYMHLQTMDDWLDVLEDEHTQGSPAVALLRNPRSPLKSEFDRFIERNGGKRDFKTRYIKWLHKKLKKRDHKASVKTMADIYGVAVEELLFRL